MNTPLRAVPQAFAHLRRFIFANRDKVPCDFYGNPCDPHNPAKWLTPEELKSSPLYFDPRYFIGFVFARGDRRFGIDLDKCFDQHGMVTLAAAAVLERFPGAYVEVSISGTGLHIIGTGDAPPHRTRAPGLELYSEGRYFLLTGSQARGDAGLDFTAALGAFVDAYGLHKAPGEVVSVIPDDGPRPGSTGVQYPDSELIAIMLAAGGGVEVRMGEKAHPRDLWHANAEQLARFWPQPGRRDGCPFDRSAAEAALFMHLSWYTGGHVSRMITLFKQSALYREGMDDAELWRKHSVPICKAAAGAKFFDQPRVPVALPGLPVPAGMVTPPAPSTHLPIEASELVSTPPPVREWTIRDLIPHKQVTLISGDGGTGKTTILLQLALAAACLTTWFGQIVEPRRVLFISGEDEFGELHFRISQIAKKMNVDGKNLFVETFESLEDAEIVVLDKVSNRIRPTPNFERIKWIIQSLGITLVILDPTADLFGGNEIDKRQVKQFISILRRELATNLGCTVILSAHPSVDAIKTGRGYSGTTAWNNSVRSRLYFTADENDADLRKLTHEKANRSKRQREIIMRWDNGIFVKQDPIEKSFEFSDGQIDRICNEIERGVNQEYDRTNKWAGHAIAKVLEIDIEPGSDLPERRRRDNIKQIKKIISHMLERRIIETTEHRERDRKPIMIYRRVINDVSFKPLEC